MTQSAATIQITPISAPSTPSWLGEVTAFAQVLTHLGVLNVIQEHVRFARARFSQYVTIDFVVVLIGYALSGEPTLKAYYTRLLPFAGTFITLFGRGRLPDRSTLSRFLVALDQAAVEATRLSQKMFWTCICIEDHLKRCLPMKMSNKTPTAGVRTPPMDRSSGKSSANGCGIFAWNSDSIYLQHPCAPRNLRQPRSPRRFLIPNAPMMLCWLMNPLPRWNMVLPTGLALPLPVVFQDQPFFSKLTRRFSAPLTISSSTRKHADQSVMARTDCYMPRALAIVVRVNCARSVRKAVPP